MKKILFIAAMLGLFNSNSFARAYNEYKEPNISKISWNTRHRIAMYCIEGYVFVYVWGSGSGITQFFKNEDGKSIPALCSDMSK